MRGRNHKFGDHRTKSHFAFLPVTMPNEEWRWLEEVTYIQTYIGPWFNLKWHNLQFIDKEIDKRPLFSFNFDSINIKKKTP